MIKQIINLKEKIVHEISEIDKIYDDVYKEITQSYFKKHEILTLEENNLKEDLQNNVTKIKEKLEKSLSASNRLIKTNEQINKGIKIFENEEEKSMIKKLSYVSKITKNQKEMKVFLNEMMKNINITFQERNLKYEEYYFSGIPTPNNIELKEKTGSSVKIFWNIDNINFKSIDNSQFKFRVEIKKEKTNEKFNKIYEDFNKTCFIENLLVDTNYQIRICLIYNDIIGPWSDVYKFKTDDIDIDSIILTESGKGRQFLEKIYEWSGCKKLELLYRGSRDGTTMDIFHNKCNKKGPTICLYKNDKDNIFGGYASISWENSGDSKPAPDSFLFTLTNIYNIEPTKFINTNKNCGVYHDAKQGPDFGSDDIVIDYDFQKKGSYSRFPDKYEDILGKGKSIFTGDFNNKNRYLNIKNIEVFRAIK